MDAAKLNQLKSFIEQCKANPSILQDPSFSFFKDYLESLGGKVPHTKVEIDSDEEEVLDGEEDEGSEPIPEPEYESDEVVESDLELEGLKEKLLSLTMILLRRWEILLLKLQKKVEMLLNLPRDRQWRRFQKVNWKKLLIILPRRFR